MGIDEFSGLKAVLASGAGTTTNGAIAGSSRQE